MYLLVGNVQGLFRIEFLRSQYLFFIIIILLSYRPKTSLGNKRTSAEKVPRGQTAKPTKKPNRPLKEAEKAANQR